MPTRAYQAFGFALARSSRSGGRRRFGYVCNLRNGSGPDLGSGPASGRSRQLGVESWRKAASEEAGLRNLICSAIVRAHMRTPAELIKEAEEAEATAKVVSYARDRDWLLAKASELRRLASRAPNKLDRTKPPSCGRIGRLRHTPGIHGTPCGAGQTPPGLQSPRSGRWSGGRRPSQAAA